MSDETALTTAPATKAAAKPWEQHKSENALWYERFLRYLALGKHRSVSLVATGRRNAYPLPSHWVIVAKEKQWRERADLFDKAVEAGDLNPASLPNWPSDVLPAEPARPEDI